MAKGPRGKQGASVSLTKKKWETVLEIQTAFFR